MQKAEKNGSSVLILFGLVGIVLVVAMSGLSQSPSPPAGDFAISNENPPPPEIQGEREIHWVTNPAGCESLRRRFRDMGRNITYVKTIRNHLGSGGFSLRFGCVFEGPDAQPGFFARDNRYEGAHEWTTP